MRKLFLLVSVILIAALASGCAKSAESAAISETESFWQETASEESSTASEQETESETEPETLFAGDFGQMQTAGQDVSDGEFLTVDDIEEGFVEIRDDMVFFDVAENAMLKIGGLPEPSENNNEYYRLDATNREAYSMLNEALACNTAGGTIRFRTDADYIAVDMKLYAVPTDFHHFTDRGVYGIDIYTGTGSAKNYCGAAMQFMSDDEELYDIIELPEGMQEVTIEMPQYAGVVYFRVGFPQGSQLAEPTARTNGPILFYGSSITQGASAGRPGNAYTNILCRALDCDCINLGFSSSDFGEQAIAEYITTRDFDIFVMDYNNNATPEVLKETHYDFYKTVRDARPDVPVVILSRPYFTDEPDEETALKEEIILETVKRAEEEGDKNVYFISSSEYFPKEQRNLYTVDMIHPNDMGHYYMAKAIFPVLFEIINEK